MSTRIYNLISTIQDIKNFKDYLYIHIQKFSFFLKTKSLNSFILTFNLNLLR